nr:DUF2141 domain-containing protein [uncultured Rhodopila sp.]
MKAGWILGCAALGVTPALAANLTVTVTGIRSNQGRIVVAICDEANFPKGACPYHGEAPARIGQVTVRVPGLPAGTWAAAVYHDEIGDQPIKYGLLGAPKQGFGFSRDARMRFGPPRFADAAFSPGDSVTVPLHYPR